MGLDIASPAININIRADILMVPRIYVDFNDLGPQIGLGFNGTLRDLSIQRIRLTNGMPLVLYDDDGDESMEVDAVVEYHPNAAFGP